MKTFFLALILGIFIGALVTAYFSSPDAYHKLVEAKTRLLEHPTAERPDPPEPIPDDSAEETQTDAEAEESDQAIATAETETGKGEPEPKAVPETETVPEIVPAPSSEPQSTAEPAEEIPAPGPHLPDANAPGADPETVDTPETSDPAPESAADERAETLAEQTPALEEAVQPIADDLTIAAAIRSQYQLERSIDVEAIAIDVENGSVTLSGTVPSAEIKQLAIDIASATKGVTHVAAPSLTVAE